MITFKPHQALEHIKKYLPENPVIIEAGAFDGKETLKMAAQWPHAIIHAFEPVPELFEKLTTTTAHLSNIHTYQLALSDKTGTATLFVAEKPEKPGKTSQASSLLKPKERLAHSSIIFPSTIEVPTITLDDWAKTYAISHVDFIWLDVQGYELNILKAAPKIVSQLKALFVEVEFIEAYENQYLYADVKSWLETQGFEMVGKDFADTPTWFFGNALFVRNYLS